MSSQQGLDLRRTIRIVRRHRLIVGSAILLGVLGGGAYALLSPPSVTSTALVALPQSAAQASAAAAAANGEPDPYTSTQEVIAGSDQVLRNALPNVSPAMSFTQLKNDIQVGSLTPYIISISAESKTAAGAEGTANAVANSYIRYIGSANSPVGKVSAQLIQPATSATGAGLVKKLIIGGIVGVIAGLLLGIVLSLAVGRRDRRLWQRDELANSVGLPVLASFPVHHPGDATAWTNLLEDYQPAPLHAWQIRNAMRHLQLLDLNLTDSDNGDGGFSLGVLSLASDPGALALGPQLAVFAASLGISTALVIGPQEELNVTSTLRAACAVAPSGSSRRSANLQVSISGDSDTDPKLDAVLTVVVMVADGRTPRMPDAMHTSATVLGVSAGAVTAEQMASAAMSAVADGREVTGILVADPESTDRTTGRAPQLTRPVHRRLPNRLRGVATEIRR
jgi:capsular polysaccharide biosynthesis protein